MESEAKYDDVQPIFEKIRIDLTWGFSQKKNGNKGLMIIADQFSKFPYAVPISDKSAEIIARE